LKCEAPKLEPGGGGINVARALKKLEGSATAIFPSGGYTGKFFNHLMEAENIVSVIIESSNETRENFIVFEETTQKQYRFGMPGTLLEENEWKQCLHAIEKISEVEFIIASGSLPPGVPADVYAQIAKIAHQKKAKFILDSSGDALRQGVEEGVYLIKPNLGELRTLAGSENITPENAEAIAKEIISKKNIEAIVVSLGDAGAILVTANDTYRAVPPKVESKSTVGAGDSMLAGIVISLANDMNFMQALQYGVACGTAATINPGTELCNKAAADYLYSIISEKQLQNSG
jgi:6-phosphofructokinase 2